MIICSQCMSEMTCKKNGRIVCFAKNTCKAGDEYECKWCGNRVVTGFSRESFEPSATELDGALIVEE